METTTTNLKWYRVPSAPGWSVYVSDYCGKKHFTIQMLHAQKEWIVYVNKCGNDKRCIGRHARLRDAKQDAEVYFIKVFKKPKEPEFDAAEIARRCGF